MTDFTPHRGTTATLDELRDVVSEQMPKGLDDYLEVKGMRRATIIVGAGLHHQAGRSGSALASWDGLLTSLGVERGDATYTVAFETALREEAARHTTNTFKPSDGEAVLQGKVRAELSDAAKVRAPNQAIYGRLLKAGYLDIINLNFDRELLASPVHVDGWSPTTDDESGKERQPAEALRRWYGHRRLRGSETRVWHPHGWVERAASIVLGRHQYAATGAHGPSLYRNEERMRSAVRGPRSVAACDDALAKYLITRRRSTWLSAVLAPRPLVIVGASLGEDELDMLWALSLRARRNFRDPRSAETLHIVPKSSDRKNVATRGLVRELHVADAEWKDVWNVIAPDR